MIRARDLPKPPPRNGFTQKQREAGLKHVLKKYGPALRRLAKR